MENPQRQGTALEVLEELKGHGFTNSFIFKNGSLFCVESEKSYRLVDLAIEAIYRFEGPSNPEDMTAVYVLRANDGTGGVLVDAYGPYADPKTAEFLSHIKDNREKSEVMNHVPSLKVVTIASLLG